MARLSPLRYESGVSDREVPRVNMIDVDHESSGGDSDDVPSPRFILVLDIGSTFTKSTIFCVRASKADNDKFEWQLPSLMGTSRLRTPHSDSDDECCEIDPEELFQIVLAVIRRNLSECCVTWDQITCVGITSQRGTFLTCRAASGDPYQPFISWKDLRGQRSAQNWNRSFLRGTVQFVGKAIRTIVEWNNAIIMSALYFRANQVIPRLRWSMEHVPGLKNELKHKRVKVALIDSWVLKRLTHNGHFLVDFSAASSTGLFSTASLGWSLPMRWVFGVPKSALPKVKPTVFPLGVIAAEHFGTEKPVTAMIADQQAAAFGHFLVCKGDAKLTVGTGAFVCVNSGSTLVYDMPNNIYTLIGWRLDGQKPTFLTETLVSDFGEILTKCRNRGLTVEDCESVPDDLENLPYYRCGADSFVSSDLARVPLDQVAHGTQRFLVIEQLAYKVAERVISLASKAPFSDKFHVDGGFSTNTVFLHTLAALLQRPLLRPKYMKEMTSFGTALLAGIGYGLWTLADLTKIHDDSGCLVEYEVIACDEKLRSILKKRQAVSTSMPSDVLQ